MHMPDEPIPNQLRTAASNVCTNILPTSRPTHSSKIAIRKLPHCSDSTVRSDTVVPCWYGVTARFAETLDHRNKLHPAGTRLVTQKPVDIERAVGVCTIDGDQDIVFDPVLLQQPEASHRLVKGSTSLSCPAGMHRADREDRRC